MISVLPRKTHCLYLYYWIKSASRILGATAVLARCQVDIHARVRRPPFKPWFKLPENGRNGII